MESLYKVEKLGNYIEQIRGISYKPSDLNDTEKEGYKVVLRANSIQDNKLILDDLIYVKEELIKEKQIIKKEDILLAASSGSKEVVGKSVQIKENTDYSFGAFCKIIRCKKNINSNYVAYFLRTKYYRAIISSVVNGANINNLKNEHIDNLLIPIPSLETQKKIVEVLDKAQSLIDKKKEQIDLLDELIKSRFIEMFGDPILNPKEWQTEKLGNISKISRGGSPRPIDKFLGGTIPWIKIGDATAGDDIYIYDTKEKIIEEGVKKSRLIKKGGLIFANCGVSLGFARILKIDGCIHDGWLAFEDFEEHLDKIFFLKSLNYCTEYFRKTAPDGTQPNLNTNIMKEYVQILPPMEKQKEFSSFIEKIDEIKSKMEASLSELEDNFNSLMQSAFKGELF